MADELRRPEVIYGEITSQQQDAELFRKTLALSRSIFEPDTAEQDRPPTSQLSTWEKHIELPGSKLILATNSSHQPVGFFFVVPRTHPEIGYELPHIWIACVDTASRGLGIFPHLTNKVKAHAMNLGYQEITVCTYPEVFPKMYRILRQHGWKEVAWPKKDVKVLMRYTL
jgi:GNAT superfamily N-acetyltransferase